MYKKEKPPALTLTAGMKVYCLSKIEAYFYGNLVIRYLIKSIIFLHFVME